MDLVSDIRIREARVRFERFALRTPFVLSHGRITDICQATAWVRVEDTRGRSAEGLGTIFLGDLWSWPSRTVSSEDRVRTMQAICEVLADGLPAAAADFAHPLEHGIHLAETYVPYITHPAARVMHLPEPVPHLAGAVCFSPFDAAMHDAFGRLHGINAYEALQPQWLPDTLDRWLGSIGKGRHVSEFLRRPPVEKLPGWHIVGLHDALAEAEVTEPTPDDLPDSLESWIEREGIFGFKLKVTGTRPDLDARRTADVYRLATSVHQRMKTGHAVKLEVDANEACSSAEPVVEYLHRLHADCPEAYNALLFLEQPVPREAQDEEADMHAATALKPVLIDEGLLSHRALPEAEQRGWNGLALKTCKGHSLMMLCLAWCGLRGWTCSMMDLTNPGLAAVHSAGLAAHAHLTFGIELNCRQFVPQANAGLSEHLPGLSRMTEGYFHFRMSGHAGLGYPDDWYHQVIRSMTT